MINRFQVIGVFGIGSTQEITDTINFLIMALMELLPKIRIGKLAQVGFLIIHDLFSI